MPAPAGDEPAWPVDAVEVGRIMGAWGVKGEFRVVAFAAEPKALFSSRRWFVRPPEPKAGPVPLPGIARQPTLLRITQARSQGDDIVAGAQEVADRDAAQALRGSRVFVARSSFPTAGADEFYWVDLIGLDVFNRQGEALGRVADLIETGAHSVLRVDPGGDAAERLIPFVAVYVDAVDLTARRIVVDWGLDY